MLPGPGAVNEAMVGEYRDERFEWDEAKAARTLRERGISFELAREVFTELAIEREDERKDYGEHRSEVIGPVRGRLTVVIYTWRGERRRLISVRKANDREVRFYVKHI